jgi:hypothetical protein
MMSPSDIPQLTVRSRISRSATSIFQEAVRAWPADQLKSGLDHGGLGRVEHERQRRRGGQPPHHLPHVGDAVPADVVDAHIEQVGAVAGLRLGDVDAVIPLVDDHRLAERP